MEKEKFNSLFPNFINNKGFYDKNIVNPQVYGIKYITKFENLKNEFFPFDYESKICHVNTSITTLEKIPRTMHVDPEIQASIDFWNQIKKMSE